MTQEIAIKQTNNEVADMLAVVARAANDPNVDPAKMHSILDVQERMMNKKAEMVFNQRMVELQMEMPRIDKNARIVHRNKTTGREEVISTYATYEHIDGYIRPLLNKYGFAMTFNSKQVGEKITVYGTIAHIEGHSVTAEIPLTMETSGAKNNVQAVGSTIAYGKRYIVGMLLNLVFEGEDDDGKSAGALVTIDEQQIAKIEKMLLTSSADREKFLAYFGVRAIEDIKVSQYQSVVDALRRKGGQE